MRKSKFIKPFALFVALNLLYEIFFPTIAFALTGGPSQPEMQSFEPIGVTKMVDVSSGDFSYNIPLMNVGNYPINLAYHSGITMDQQASWVGLGWNINPGAITRQMRGLPDDFEGEKVTKQFNMKKNITVGIDVGASGELFGLPDSMGSVGLSAHAGIFYNNYKGPGLSLGISPSIAVGISSKGTLTAGLGLNFNSQSGTTITPTVGLSHEVSHINNNETDAGITVGVPINSRSGIKSVVMTADLNAKGSGVGKDKDKTKYGYKNSVSRSSTLNFASPTYTPTINMPINNYAFSLHFTAGSEVFGLHPNMTFSGYANIQTLATHEVKREAYGYMYADYSGDNPNALLDFNREKDVPFRPHIAHLPITNFTYDLFNVSGQGIGGQFRAFRGDVGVLYDPMTTEGSLNLSLGAELGFGLGAHLGVDIAADWAHTTTKRWTSDNDFGNTVDFKGLEPGNINYEPYCFKFVGEKTKNDQSFYNKLGGTKLAYVQLDRYGSTVNATNTLTYNNNTTQPLNANPHRTQRDKRDQSISVLTANEANYFALDRTINSYPLNINVYASQCSGASGITKMSRNTWSASEISQITVTKPGGKRYVYGIPAYNFVKKAATFAVNRPNSNQGYDHDGSNIVTYAPTDNSTSNTEGIDHYFSEETTPDYAHSFLLTGILSPDYVDRTSNGISDDDLGQAVKINYTRLYGEGNPYKWRNPVEFHTATYQEGFKTDPSHDKGNYIYGEKAIWFVHSIESKTMVAQFILENRKDGLGVFSEDGGPNSAQALKRLKEIKLYSKADLIKNGANAVPIKTVHFVYDYQLCPGTPNSVATGGGKLTLKKVYFTYGNNTEGSLNSYQFSYNGINPAYSHIDHDRWGYFKQNPSNIPPTNDFPYTLQDSVKTNAFATAWELTDIDLPSGGHIKVHYQSDDYAYVQNVRATQMFLVEGVNNSASLTGIPAASSPTQLYHSIGSAVTEKDDWLIVHLPDPVVSTDDFYAKYLAGINQGDNKLYFRFLVKVNGKDKSGKDNYEYVPGYADIASYQMINSTTGAIKLAEVSTGANSPSNKNPITLAAWQYVRLNLPGIAYPGSQTSGSILGIAHALVGILSQVIGVFTSFDKKAVVRGLGKYCIPSRSYIRLDNPSYKKLGGGCRVSEIDISDNWSDMVGAQKTFTYGKTFNYTTTLQGGQVISSGVATYEPLLGGDENPLHQPIIDNEEILCAPDNTFYTTKPLGESLYPAPGVVYSKVTVTNLKHTGVHRTATGYTVHEFYTAKDFPVINKWTDLDVERVKPQILSELFSLGVEDYSTASQGFLVETNDMAGKEKSKEVYNENGALISSINYHYKVDNNNSHHLNNNVDVINPDGSISSSVSIGKDIDTWEDMREQDSHTYGATAKVQLDILAIPFPVPPIPVPTVWPGYSSEHTRFRSAVTTKYIHRNGILSSITKMKNGSTVTTKNLLYDGETGNVLLTQTNNEFEAPQYNFTYPAHWAYDGMGSAYRNIGAVFSGVSVTSGVITGLSNPASFYFTPGDEVEYFNNNNTFSTPHSGKYWIAKPQSQLILIDINGTPVSGLNNVTLKIIRSGRRNMAATPIATLVSMVSPRSGNTIKIDSSLKILQAKATLFNDAWRIPTTNILWDSCYSEPLDSNCYASVAQFLNSVIVNHQLFSTLSNNLTFGTYTQPCAQFSASDLYYALDAPQGYDQMSSFTARLGGCTMTIKSLSGNPVYLDSLTTISYQNQNTGGYTANLKTGCIYLYYRTPGRNPNGGPGGEGLAQTNNAVAEACFSCLRCDTVCTNLAINQPFNPYAVGMLGDWRPDTNYVYYTDRSPSFTAGKTDIWTKGYFKHFNSIWDKPTSGNIWALDTLDNNWTWTGRITMYNPKGSEIENIDALGRPSSALYGYLQSLPTAVSSNAKYKDIAFDGFEDYGFTNNCGNPCDNSHFSFTSALNPPRVDTTSTQSHTGFYSLEIKAHRHATVSRAINNYGYNLFSVANNKFYLLNGGSIPLFSPESGKYLVSAWVKEDAPCGVTGYTRDKIKISFTGSSQPPYSFAPSGPVIEGWQRIYGYFDVPANAIAISVKLHAGNAHNAYFDDIRIEPFKSKMKTYVYNPSSLRLMAVLDENNYATLYEYNDEGILQRVKKETERGIMTIKETRSSYPRK